MQVNGSVALVTGGASGLGEAVVRRLIDLGAAGVTIVDLSEEKATALANELGDRVHVAVTDVRNTEQVEAAVQGTVDRFGRLDVAVCCAGIGWAQRTVDKAGAPANLDAYKAVIDINLVGTFDVVRNAASAMSRNEPNEDGERGAIVMTASVAAFDGQIGQAAYSASKGGIVGMTLPLARDLAATGIRIGTVAPGLIDTPIYDFAPPELKENLSKTPVFPRRLGYSSEFAHLVQTMIENGYLNGEVIRLDAALRMAPK
jgi:NAD(P)-dependent dehydrogenase (short-subunit alcohol dehydrogenase family)